MTPGFLDPIDVTIVHDLMMLVLSCHTHVFCPSIIRIALRLLLSSVAMFYIWAIAIFARCNVDRVSYMPNPMPVGSLVT